MPVRGRPRPQPAPERGTDGRSARSPRSCRTPGTQAARCGTGSAPTASSPIRAMSPSGTRACSGGTCPTAGSSPSRPAHPALVSEEDFVAAQAINAARGPAPQDEPVVRQYLLAGLLDCGVCGRRMESAWSNGKAGVPVPPWPHQRDGARPVPAEEHLHPRGQAAAAPARPTPAAHHPRHARQAPHPGRRRCQGSP